MRVVQRTSRARSIGFRLEDEAMDAQWVLSTSHNKNSS